MYWWLTGFFFIVCDCCRGETIYSTETSEDLPNVVLVKHQVSVLSIEQVFTCIFNRMGTSILNTGNSCVKGYILTQSRGSSSSPCVYVFVDRSTSWNGRSSNATGEKVGRVSISFRTKGHSIFSRWFTYSPIHHRIKNPTLKRVDASYVIVSMLFFFTAGGILFNDFYDVIHNTVSSSGI